MRRRDFLSTALTNLAADSPRRPNIALILVDDLGWMDLGCQGSTFYETPEIDRMAREGARFTNAYSNCPVCSPSRAALMTGRYPARVGFTGHITATGRHRYPPHGRIVPPDDYLFLKSEEVTLAEALKPSGYRSASVGKWHLGSRAYWPERQGFDVNVAGYDSGSPPAYFYPYKNPKQDWNSAIPTLQGGKPGEYLTDRLTDEAIRFVESREANQPFFLYLPHYAVHMPLQAQPDLVAKYEKKLRTDSSQKSAVYAAMVESVDRSVRRLRQTLERMGILDETLIVITSDNGGELRATSNAPLREGKGCLYEGGIRVPLILRWPKRIRAGAVRDDPVTGADLFPTILDMAGVKAPPVTLDGVSLATSTPQRDLFWYYPHYSPQFGQPAAAVRSGNRKLIEFYDPPKVELYDLARDPREQTNLSARLPKETADLRGRLHRHLQAVRAIRHTANPAFQPVQ